MRQTTPGSAAMSMPVRTEFAQRMAFEGRLHVRFEAAAAAPADAQLQALAERNAHLLGAIALLEERRAERERDEDGAMAQELARLDAKLSLLIEIVNRLLAPAASLPPRQPVRFNGLGAEVPAALVPADAAQGRLLLHFDACPALPLELACRVEMAAETAFLAFVQAGEAVEEGLDRFVFRHHRRKLADVRQSTA
jgi:hypothetical protein